MKGSNKTGTAIALQTHTAKAVKRPAAIVSRAQAVSTRDLDNSGKISAAVLRRRRTAPFNPKEVSDRLDREFTALKAQEEGK